MNNKYTTAAAYLAGYAVECALKAVILSQAPAQRQAELLRLFHGTKAHDFEWLKALYLKESRAQIPAHVADLLRRVSTWSTDLRYHPGRTKAGEAGAFLNHVSQIIEWAQGRI